MKSVFKKGMSYVGVAVFSLVTAAYFSSAILRSLHSPFWMDEVLAVTAAQQSNFAGVVGAIWAGTDFSPPTYHLVLHGILGLASNGLLVPRLASIVAVYGAGLCIYIIARRRFSLMVSLVAFGMTLASPLFDYAVQVRQYGLMSFLLAAALALWDGLGTSASRPFLKLIGIWAAMATCVSLHFYGIIAVGAIGLCEVLWTVFNRKVRFAVWCTLAMVGPVFLAWIPLATHLRHISAGDQVGPGFYGYPTIHRLFHTIFDLVFGGQPQLLVYGGAILAILACRLCPSYWLPLSDGEKETVPSARGWDQNLVIILAALAMIPVVAYVLGVVATGSFVGRYALGIALFPGLALACALSATNHATVSAVLVSPCVVLSLLSQAKDTWAPAPVAALKLLREQPLLSPVMIGDGQLYTEMVGALAPADRERIIYLAKPKEAESPDPTNENAVKRLSSFDSRFRYTEYNDALQTNGKFYVLRSITGATDIAFQELLRHKFLGGLIAESMPVQIYTVEQNRAQK
jgi:hypothetical protein